MKYERPPLSRSPTARERARSYLPTLPILTWLPQYRREWLPYDCLAGFTVAMLEVPQSLAYATLASLPARNGLLSAYIGPAVYPFFGTSRDCNLGPTALMSIIVSLSLRDRTSVADKLAIASALSLFAGLLQVAMGLLHLGFVIDLLSLPVVSGFISAASVTIVVGQLKTFVGTKGSERSFLASVSGTVSGLGPALSTHWPDLLLGLAVMALLYVLQWQTPSSLRTPVDRVRRGLALARGSIVVVLATALAYLIHSSGLRVRYPAKSELCASTPTRCSPFSLVGPIPGGFESVFAWPALSLDVFHATLPYVPIVTFVGFLEAIAICRSLARDGAYVIDSSQELIAMGVTNCAAAFASAFPTTASFSRTAANRQANVRSPLSGLISALLIVAAIEFATPLLAWIPKVALAAIIVTAAARMFEVHAVKLIWSLSPPEVGVCGISFSACLLLDISYGVATAAFASFALFVYQSSQPPLIESTLRRCVVVQLRGPVLFPAAHRLRRALVHIVANAPLASAALVLDLSAVTRVDATAAIGMDDLLAELEGLPSPSPSPYFPRDSTVDPELGLAPPSILLDLREDERMAERTASMTGSAPPSRARSFEAGASDDELMRVLPTVPLRRALRLVFAGASAALEAQLRNAGPSCARAEFFPTLAAAVDGVDCTRLSLTHAPALAPAHLTEPPATADPPASESGLSAAPAPALASALAPESAPASEPHAEHIAPAHTPSADATLVVPDEGALLAALCSSASA